MLIVIDASYAKNEKFDRVTIESSSEMNKIVCFCLAITDEQIHVTFFW